MFQYWDDWLREPKQRQGRHIIRPEVCRSFHFGTHGVSNAQYSQYLNSIRLNDIFVPFTSLDLSYLSLENWNKQYLSSVRSSKVVTMDDYDEEVIRGNLLEVRLTYEGFEGPSNSFSRLAEWSGAMDNVKANVPRTAYKGIVSLWKGNVKVHLVPKEF